MSRSLSPFPAEVTLVVRAVRRAVPCPDCAQPSSRIHSYYQRRLAHLPWRGVPVKIRLRARRFFCDAEDCPHRVFTERLPETTETYARRTFRMEQALRLLGLALGGEAGARTAQRLGLAVSGDTVLRHLRRMSLTQKLTFRLACWAWMTGRGAKDSAITPRTQKIICIGPGLGRPSGERGWIAGLRPWNVREESNVGG